MILKNINSYVYYSYFQEAHFVAIDDLPPILPKLFAITDKDEVLVTMPYFDLFKQDFKNISFSQSSLFAASKINDYIAVEDLEGVSRKIRFFKLHNIMTDDYKKFLNIAKPTIHQNEFWPDGGF